MNDLIVVPVLSLYGANESGHFLSYGISEWVIADSVGCTIDNIYYVT